MQNTGLQVKFFDLGRRLAGKFKHPRHDLTGYPWIFDENLAWSANLKRFEAPDGEISVETGLQRCLAGEIDSFPVSNVVFDEIFVKFLPHFEGWRRYRLVSSPRIFDEVFST